jgi:hypothetical protein
MAKRGSSKWFSEQHERFIAKRHRGTRSPSSGAAISDQGDIRTGKYLIECKHRGSYTRPAKSIPIDLDTLEKICREAWSEGKNPMLALRMYNPDSMLSDKDGMIDLIVRLERDERI